MEALAAVNVSMGLMLEQTTPRCEKSIRIYGCVLVWACGRERSRVSADAAVVQVGLTACIPKCERGEQA